MMEYYLVVFRQIDFVKIFKNIMFVGFGVILLIIGIISLVIPISPGLLFIFLGLTSLIKGSSYFKKHKLLNRVLDEIRKQLYRYKKV